MDHTPGQRQFRDTAKLRVYLMGKHGYDDAGVEAHIDGIEKHAGCISGQAPGSCRRLCKGSGCRSRKS